MRNCLSVLFAVLLFESPGFEITNYVYVVSNIYTRSVHEVTNNVKNTHFNYYFTNNVYTVTNVTTVFYSTNLTTNVDIGESYLAAASGLAGQAGEFAESARSHAESAADSAGAASGSERSAKTYYDSTVSVRNSAASECAEALNRINERINWFDRHSGETITMVTTNVNLIIDNSFEYVYKSPAGTSYANIRIRPNAADGDRYRLYRPSGSSYAGANVAVYVRNSSTSDGVAWWYMRPAFVDSDEFGLRFQYLPDMASMEKLFFYRNVASQLGTQTNFTDERVVPEYLYWQNGKWFFKVNVWKAGKVNRWAKWEMNQADWPNSYLYAQTPSPGSGYYAEFSQPVEANNFGTVNYRDADFATVSRTGDPAMSFPETVRPQDAIAALWGHVPPTVYPNNTTIPSSGTSIGSIVDSGVIIMPKDKITALP